MLYCAIMGKNPVPNTYLNKDGKPVDIATGKVLRQNKDGSIDMNQFNTAITKGPQGLEAAQHANHKMSPYTGEDAGKNWEKLWAQLTESPMLLTKAIVSAGFTMKGFRAHLSQNKSLQERFDLIQGGTTDEYEQNIHDIAHLPIEEESKALPTILRANETALNAKAKSRGYGIKQSAFNIEGNSLMEFAALHSIGKILIRGNSDHQPKREEHEVCNN